MKRLLNILLFLAFTFSGLSQTFEINSLKELINNSETKKEEKIDAYISLSKEYDGDSAIYFAEEGKKYAKEIKYNEGIAKMNTRLAGYNIEKGDFEIALNFYLEILKDSSNITATNLGSAYNGMGSIYRRMKDYDKAIAIYNKAEEIANKTKKPIALASVYNNKAIIYDLTDELDTSVLYYKKCLEYIPLVEDKQLSIRFNFAILVNMGILYNKMGEYEKGLENHKKALVLAKKENNDYFIANALMTIGGTYNEQKKYLEAEKYLTEGLTLSIESDNKFFVQDFHSIKF